MDINAELKVVGVAGVVARDLGIQGGVRVSRIVAIEVEPEDQRL